ncbi:ammonia-forming cytochrome c nitrite reductase subunit c552 [Thiovibrio frasassiensis]|uniref:nitrite reductase (cytochrome; ammonia-forming) n=1 Tax=Thiovibrio frasassiensis TaxID=2984131 RepID=A0A9X4RP95_9BACT|nr:ammonia-forming cytochrome c nitrite reductase subunit c552 [Thiovibrio frasassiensis]MDG4475012.1 ammonia-forming cytochrome c nitrite reductase subunit c552 [Thiovibrio frasassiensis]
MQKKLLLPLVLLVTGGVLLTGCKGPEKVEAVRAVKIADGEMDPAEWGKAYPVHYDLWKKTAEPTPAGKSKYKRGFNADGITYDKLSEFPYMALLFNGWGFGVEYNEPRGHAFMLKDQVTIDPARVGAGGVCLTCKTPYAPQLEKEKGFDYYSKPWAEVRDMIPEKFRDLGVACVDCHDNNGMGLKLSREFTLGKALEEMKVDRSKLTHQDMRTLVCAQCHVTYNIKKDENKKSVGVYFPWQGSTYGDISVENIIKQIRSDNTVGEWTQKVTGYKMPFMRHPEFELYSRNSVHWMAGAACADCHMPYTKVGSNKLSDHRVTSPLKADMKACQQCHTETPEWLRQQVITIQDRTASMMVRSGYATATVAKLIERVHTLQAEGKEIDQKLYEKAKDFYMEAFFRSLFIGAENSIGFHNPTEAMRILGDSTAFATKAEGLLRQALTKAGEDVPMNVNLELDKYLNERGKKKLMQQKDVEFKDPFGVEEKLNTVTPVTTK